MSQLDRLQELLDEHGVEYKRKSFFYHAGVEHYVTWRGVGGMEFCAIISVSDPEMLYINDAAISPEDAVAVTVGREVCHDTEDYVCPQCGTVMDYITRGDDDEKVIPMDDYVIPLHYCPNCGRKVFE